ncbi:MAG: hypothetical protein IPM55_06120 [Acidobacteria bacterium]|nr:hypothetical protein [Acidobacteriota bacterium]
MKIASKLTVAAIIMLALFATQAQKCSTPKNNAFVDPDGRAIDPNDERNQQLIAQRILKDGRYTGKQTKMRIN